ncbi:MAG: hydroxyacylglutathione hydrolase [Gammaproteobacteria bacterium]
MLHVTPVRAFRDNYIWMIRAHADADDVVIVDPGDAAPVMDALKERQWRVAAVLLTHHHFDHVGGVAALKERYDVPVYGPAGSTIPTITHPVTQGDTVTLAALDRVFEVGTIPGHTLDHIYYFGHDAVFCGDTLFSAGCGRLFEGSAKQMQASLATLRGLPDSTRVFCAHEYTLDNLKFADAVEPGNAAIDDYTEYASRLRREDLPTLPSHMALEKKVNPFLRWDTPAVREAAARHVGHALTDDVSVFETLRKWKDTF